MDLNRLIVGEGAILSMGYPLSTRKGKLLHPLIRTVDAFSRNKAIGSVALLVAALSLGYFSSDRLGFSIPLAMSNANLLNGRAAPTGQVAPEPPGGAPLVQSTAAPIRENPPPEDATLVPAAVLAAATPASGAIGDTSASVAAPSAPAIPAMPSPYAVPAHAVIVPPPVQADLANNNTRPAQQKVLKPEVNAASPITVLDVSAGEEKKEPAAKPNAPLASPVKPVAAIAEPQTQGKSLVEAGPAAQEQPVAPPSVQLPKMSDVPKAKPEPAKPVKPAKPKPASRKEQEPKAEAPLDRPLEQPEQTRQRKLSEANDEGFAKPIRERQVGGIARQEVPAQTQRVEVLDITRNAVIVTNPRTKLPVMVGVGDRLPNGAVLTSVNPAGGTANTSAGQLRMD